MGLIFGVFKLKFKLNFQLNFKTSDFNIFYKLFIV